MSRLTRKDILKSDYNLPITGFVFVALLSLGCNRPSRTELRDSLLLITDEVEVYYTLGEPDYRFFLPYALAEISGLTFRAPNSLLAVQDEDGILYEFDLTQMKITGTTKFDTPNDFEGVELIGDSVFVLESDGDLRLFRASDPGKIEKIETPLESKNDAEGLGYDPSRNALLIACKGEGLKKGAGKMVYQFNLDQMKLEEQPVFKITKKDLELFYEQHRDFDYDPERFRFEPSAIAYNPIDGYFYILAHIGKLLIAVDSAGQIKATYPIPAALLGQPEGLCFSPDGALFISSEGEGDKGYFVKYSPRRK